MSKKKTNIESKITQLNEIVQTINDDDTTIEDAIGHYSKAITLAGDTFKDLDTLKNRVTEIKKNSDGLIEMETDQ